MNMRDEYFDVKKSIFIKALANVDGSMLDKVLDDMNYGIEDLYHDFYSSEERLYNNLMNQMIKQVNKLNNENKKENVEMENNNNGSLKGIVKWFDTKKGYGFITDSETGKEIFVHFSGIHGDGFRKLFENDKVTFEIKKTDKGLNAVNVIKEKKSK